MLVGVGLAWFAVHGRQAGWLLAAAGVLNTSAAVVGLGLAALRTMWRERRVRYAFYGAVTVLLVIVELRIVTGQWLVSGYDDIKNLQTVLPYSHLPGFSYPLGFGILSILFSFGKGLLFFCPGLLLLWPRLRRPEPDDPLRECYLLWLCFLVGLILVYGKWWAWYAGWCYGPRFFLFASLPTSLVLAERLAQGLSGNGWVNLGVWGIMLLQVWAGICGAVFGTDNLAVCSANEYQLEYLTWYVPEFSVLWRPFIAMRELRFRDLLVLVYGAAVMLLLSWPFIVFFAGRFKYWGGVVRTRLSSGWRW